MNVKKIHKDMWAYIESNEKVGRINCRAILKAEWCRKNDKSYFLHHCALCEYAKEQSILLGLREWNRCKACPAIWSDSSTKHNPGCLCELGPGLNWLTSNPALIKDIKFKDDIEKE